MANCKYLKSDLIQQVFGGFHVHTCTNKNYKSKDKISIGKLKGRPMVGNMQVKYYCHAKHENCEFK